MNFRFRYFLLVVFLGTLLFLGTYWLQENKPVCSSEEKCEEIIFTVRRGEGLDLISKNLQGKNLIRNSLIFKIQVVINRLAKKMQAGDYYLSGKLNTLEIAKSMTKGSFDKKVTIQEGLRAEEIGQLLVSQGIGLNLIQWQEIIKSKKLEGFLFPDTYMLSREDTEEEIIKVFQKNLDTKLKGEVELEMQAKGMDKFEVMTLASIVEREARHELDRPIVAGILQKRIKNDWPLQVDATVQYLLASKKCLKPGTFQLVPGCDWWPNRLTKEDLKMNSSYNTYLNKGLPPGPICNPGLSSIRAVVFAKDSPYWYYLSDTKGNIHYATTDKEHAANIEKYLSQ